MNDEIKEILDYLNKSTNSKDFVGMMIRKNHLDKLLNYITNLENQLKQASLEIQELTERDLWCPTNCDKLINLQKENERLKTALNGSKEIRKKAIEYIKEDGTTYLNLANQRKWCSEFSAENILKILGGDE